MYNVPTKKLFHVQYKCTVDGKCRLNESSVHYLHIHTSQESSYVTPRDKTACNTAYKKRTWVG